MPTSTDPKPASAAAPATAGGDDHVLSRTFLQEGGVAAMVARMAPTLRLLSDAERQASLQTTLAQRPAGAAWLFGYGSLIWNPTIHSVEHRVAKVQGWRRAFCLSVQAGRGSAERPGLVLGLDAGGACTGVAYRIDEAVLHAELELLWRREMVAGSYIPRWVEVHDENGVCFGSAIAFTMDTACEQYAGALERHELVDRLATAAGALGSSADYLFRTCAGLRERGVVDEELERLAAEVAQRQRHDEGDAI